jgi:oligopeptide/dipeptide ABC transporter ATP-binding protein
MVPIAPKGAAPMDTATTSDAKVLLDVRQLQTQFPTKAGTVRVLDGLDLTLLEGHITGLVGESGSGKSVTAFSLLRLLRPPGKVVGGEIWYRGQNLMTLSDKEMTKVRGNEIGMIFQQPRASLNPVFRVGEVLTRVMKLHRGLRGKEAREEAMRVLQNVGLPHPERIMASYPHELSGGMCQRVMIAQVLACQPKLLIADEPTTALDVTIQMQIVQLLRSLRDRFGLTQLLITHDLGLVGEMCDHVVVMYAGEIVERSPVLSLFDMPSHPYTRSLMGSRANRKNRDRLYSIPGTVPNLLSPPTGCRFNPRCPYAQPICKEESPKPERVAANHWVRCHFWRDVVQAEPARRDVVEAGR